MSTGPRCAFQKNKNKKLFQSRRAGPAEVPCEEETIPRSRAAGAGGSSRDSGGPRGRRRRQQP